MSNNADFDWETKTWKIIDRFFRDKTVFVRHHLDSFNYFLNTEVQNIVREKEYQITVSADWDDEKKMYCKQYQVFFDNIYISKPVIYETNGNKMQMYPNDARLRNLTYDANFMIDIKHRMIEVDRKSGEKTIKDYPTLKKFDCGKIPIMLRSDFCVLSKQSDYTASEMGECMYDMGGYFVVKGGEKVIVCQERKCENKVYCFKQKSQQTKYSHEAEISSVNPKSPSFIINTTVKLTARELNYGKAIRVSVRSVKVDIPLFILFRALGITSDKKIVEMIIYDLDNKSNNKLIDMLKGSIVEASSFQSKETALEYISKNIPTVRQGTYQALESKLKFTENKLMTMLFPHLGDTPVKKAFFLGYMVNKLLKTYFGILPYDDRDSFLNKKVETSGELMAQLFRSNFSKFVKDAKRGLEKDVKAGKIDECYKNLSRKFKPNEIAGGINWALSTGTWGAKSQSKQKKGVAQMLQRLNFLGFLSNLRRIIAPLDRNGKQTDPRKLHSSQFGTICPFESPEGGAVGIVKNMALMCHITIPSNPEPILACLEEFGIIPLENISPSMISRTVKIFVNGDWIGQTDKPNEVVTNLKKMRRSGLINIYTSIAWDVHINELKIRTDGGRLCRPLYVVKDRKLILNENIISEVEANNMDWQEILGRNIETVETECDLCDKVKNINDDNCIVEYVDTDEANTCMIAMTYDNLLNNSMDNNSYYNYTHCEIHPAMIFGVLVCNVPFPDHNQSPRNVYQAAMGKQAIGIYNTAFAKRFDTAAHILHYPQKPVCNTLTSMYVFSDDIPCGMNPIVAVACFTGYNQEDSLIYNQTSISRGLMNTNYYRTYKDEEKKNQSTLEDEKFQIPEKHYPNGKCKTERMSYGSYDKIQKDGFPKEGTHVEGGDIIVGKVIPLKNTEEDSCKYRDASKVLRANESGIVSKVYVNRNGDGYKFCKIKIMARCEPEIGDKFACYTDDHDVLTDRGWISIKDVDMNCKVACLDKGKHLVYRKPTEIMSYDFNGQLYELNNAQISVRVTKNHRMYIGNRKASDYQIAKAEECYGKRWRFMKNCDSWIPDLENCPEELKINDDETEASHFVLPSGREIDLNSWLTLFGLWIIDGCVTDELGVVFVKYNDYNKDILLKTCETIGVDLNVTSVEIGSKQVDVLHIDDEDIVEYMQTIATRSDEKYIPDWAWYLTREQSKILLFAIEDSNQTCNKSNMCKLRTTSEKFAGGFQKLCLHAGWSSNSIDRGLNHVSYNVENGEIVKEVDEGFDLLRVTSHNKPIFNKYIDRKTGEGRNDKYVNYKGKVYCCSVEGDGIIYVRRHGYVYWCGNSRHGQKGTIGMMYKQEDMPFTKDGVSPDIIMNPNALPKRMTIAQLIECAFAKVSVLKGMEFDATPFRKTDVTGAGEILKSLGFKSSGKEVLYNGRTGQQIVSDIFIGPTYYYRLKHLVRDKIHSRSSGPYQLLTRQPSEGRARDGGLRFGEMERDCMIAHGTVQFLKERTFNCSDKYFVWVDKETGMISPVNPSKGIYKSLYSNNTTNFAKVHLPYASKLLIQELMAMHIVPRIITDEM